MARPKGSKTKKPNAYIERTERVKLKYGEDIFHQWGKLGGNPILLKQNTIGENVCCPLLTIMNCGDTDEHKHLYCDSQHTIEDCVISNEWTIQFCLGEFKDCKYYPRGE